jgi:hypothetical protein
MNLSRPGNPVLPVPMFHHSQAERQARSGALDRLARAFRTVLEERPRAR